MKSVNSVIIGVASVLSFAALAYAASDVVVDQVGQKFSVPTLTVKAGKTVDFMNSDDVNHNITIIDANGNADDRGIQKPNTTIPVTFDKAGDFVVRCSVHPRMKMQVKVE